MQRQSVREQLRRVTVTALSPGHAVNVRLAESGEYRVEILDGASRRLSEAALSAEIKAAVNGVRTGYGEAVREIIAAAREGRETPDVRDTGNADKHRRYSEAVTAIEMMTTSPGGCVRAGWRGPDGFDLRIRPGTLRDSGLSESQLTAEVNAAINSAMGGYAKARTKAHEHCYPLTT